MFWKKTGHSGYFLVHISTSLLPWNEQLRAGGVNGQPQLTAARSLKEGEETILRFYLSVFPQLPCFMIQWNDVKLFFTNIFFSELIYWDFFLLFFPCLIETYHFIRRLRILSVGFLFFWFHYFSTFLMVQRNSLPTAQTEPAERKMYRLQVSYVAFVINKSMSWGCNPFSLVGLL
jgi:hypothetical protein